MMALRICYLPLLTFAKSSIFLLLFITSVRSEDESEREIESSEALYDGDNVDELMALCKGVQFVTIEEEEGEMGSMACYPPDCMTNCNKYRFNRLQLVQNRTRDMLTHLDGFYTAFLHLFFFFVVLLLGFYLIAKGHFKWRTLPIIGNKFEDDPTDGYRYSHFMWMQWVTLDSENPIYYKGMTPETQEIEYRPQHKEWQDPMAESDEDLQPSWSIRDIYDMTADPHERLEFYFRRIQQEHHSNKHFRQNIKNFKKFQPRK